MSRELSYAPLDEDGQVPADRLLNAAGGGPHTHDAADIDAGTIDDARIPSGITRDSELTAHDHDADYEASGAVATHAGLADPHTGYQKESEKSAASGYASLDGSTKVPIAELPTGTTGTTVALGDAAAGLITTHEGLADPHTGYVKESEAAWILQSNEAASRNVSAAGQVISANTVTYLTSSGILIPSVGMVVGQMYRWIIIVNKTAAGTATPVWTFRVGTNQTTADTTVLTVTGTAQVATLSGTRIEVVAFVRTVSATVGVVTGGINTGAASFGIGGSAVSGNFNNSADAGKRFGLCVNTGASAAWTVNSVMGELT